MNTEYQITEENGKFIVQDSSGKYETDLRTRIFNFVIRVVKYLKKFPKSAINDVIVYQLMKAATSMGANYSPGQMLHRSKPRGLISPGKSSTAKDWLIQPRIEGH